MYAKRTVVALLALAFLITAVVFFVSNTYANEDYYGANEEYEGIAVLEGEAEEASAEYAYLGAYGYGDESDYAADYGYGYGYEDYGKYGYDNENNGYIGIMPLFGTTTALQNAINAVPEGNAATVDISIPANLTLDATLVVHNRNIRLVGNVTNRTLHAPPGNAVGGHVVTPPSPPFPPPPPFLVETDNIRHIVVTGGGTLYLSNLILQGPHGPGSTTYSGGIAATGSTVIMENNSVIQGNRHLRGGGMRLVNSTLTMQGNAQISNNSVGVVNHQIAQWHFTPLVPAGASAPHVPGTLFVGNDGWINGGGLHTTNSTITMSGTARIADNRAYVVGTIDLPQTGSADRSFHINESANGGGVHMNGGTFEMSGSSRIAGNSTNFHVINRTPTSHSEWESQPHQLTQNANGGGVHLVDGSFLMDGNARIEHNSTYFRTGFVANNTDDTYDNDANGSVIGSVNRNANGGGVAVRFGGSFTMGQPNQVNDVQINDNTAEADNHLNMRTITLPANPTPAQIEHQLTYQRAIPSVITLGCGGGVYLEGRTGTAGPTAAFTMHGGSIVRNHALAIGGTTGGGGVFVGGDGRTLAVFTMNGGIIGGTVADPANGIAANPANRNTIGETPGGRASGGGGVAVLGNNSFHMNYSQFHGAAHIAHNSIQNTSPSGGGVLLSGGHFYMRHNSLIAYNQTGFHGGGVQMTGGNFHMLYNALIRDNIGGTGAGGGVNMTGGTFNMGRRLPLQAPGTHTPEIRGHTRFRAAGQIDSGILNLNGIAQSGGGVNMSGGTFHMCDHAQIHNNISGAGGAPQGRGGGVAMAGGQAIFHMHSPDARIHNNTAINMSLGGGVFIQNGRFYMQDGRIYNNRGTGADAMGGGVYLTGVGHGTALAVTNQRTRFHMYGGEIGHENPTLANQSVTGGGVAISGGNFINAQAPPAAVPPVNNPAGNWNPVVSFDPATFNMFGGQIFNNTAPTRGGGVHVQNGGLFNMFDGEIYNHTSENGGGVSIDGILVPPWAAGAGNPPRVLRPTTGAGSGTQFDGLPRHSTFAMEGGYIRDNEADFMGGGVHITNGGWLELRDGSGEIIRNEAPNGGGVAVRGIFELPLPPLTAPNAPITCLDPDNPIRSGFTLAGGVVGGENSDGNLATATSGEGGGVHVSGNGWFDMVGGEVRGNEATYGAGVYVTRRTITPLIASLRGTVWCEEEWLVEMEEMHGYEWLAAFQASLAEYEAFSEGEASLAENSGVTARDGIITPMPLSAPTFRPAADQHFTMRPGAPLALIWENVAEHSGGGVYLENGVRFDMTGGNIRTNEAEGTTAARGGGGVFVTGGFGTGANFEPTIFNQRGGIIGGVVEDHANLAQRGGGVFVSNGASFYMEEGGIAPNLTRGTIMGNEAAGAGTNSRGGGVFVTGSVGSGANLVPSSFTMSAGDIYNNEANRGGGVGLLAGAEFRMTGGRVGHTNHVLGNWAEANGGGVHIDGVGSEFRMSGNAEVLGNRTDVHGAVRLSGGGRFYLSGDARVHNNWSGFSSATNNRGGGVSAGHSGSHIEMSGGIIENNRALVGGGIMVDHLASVRISGGVIRNNRYTVNNTPISQGGGVWIGPGLDAVSVASGIMTGGVIENNQAVNGGGVWVGGGASFEMNPGVVNDQLTYGRIRDNLATGILAPVDGGGGVHMAGTASEFTMRAGVIGGDSDQGEGNSAAQGGGVFVSSGTFTMTDGSVILDAVGLVETSGRVSGNAATGTAGSSGGGGVYLSGTAPLFILEAGVIGGDAEDGEGNTALHGGGVFIQQDGTFEMDGGRISGNTATGVGGGVCLGSGAGNQFTMTDGTIGGTIDGESNSAGTNGGGVRVGMDSIFDMYGGTIVGNEAPQGGGVVVIADATFNLRGTDAKHITGNEADYGGGVWVHADGEMQMQTGATNVYITNNTAEYDGGGIFTESYEYAIIIEPGPGVFDNLTILESATFSGNTAQDWFFPPSIPTETNNQLPNIAWDPADGSSPPQWRSTYLYLLNNYDINFRNPGIPFEFFKLDHQDNRMAGAQFQLYRWDPAADNGNGDWVEMGTPVTSSAAPHLGWVGRPIDQMGAWMLSATGEYRLRETQAPSGFATPQGHWTVQWNAGLTPARFDITASTNPDNPAFGWNAVGEYHYVSNDRAVRFAFHKTDERLYSEVSQVAGADWAWINDEILLDGAYFTVFAWNGPGTPPMSPLEDALVNDTTIGPTQWTEMDFGVSTGDVDSPIVFYLNPSFRYFQLVETQAPDGFDLPWGQWRLSLQEASSQPTAPPNQGVYIQVETGFWLRIWTVGDDSIPAFARQDPDSGEDGAGEWYLGNRPTLILPALGGEFSRNIFLLGGLFTILTAMLVFAYQVRVKSVRYGGAMKSRFGR